MEQEKKHKFYSLAKYPNLEIMMESQLASAGANQARLLEKYKKNKKSIKHQLIALKIFFAFIFIFIPTISIIGYFDILSHYASAPMETILFSYTFIFGIFFLISILYILLMGLFTTSSFMSGKAFKWLQTLPLSKKDLRKLGYVTIFRNLDIALIALIFGFPTILLIVTQNFILFFPFLISSVLNAIFGFSLLVIISQKMANVFSESSGNTKKAYLLRILTMGGFMVLAFGTSFILTWAMNSLGSFFIIFPTNESVSLLNRILSLIPYPFGISYILACIITPGILPLDIILTSVIGLILSIGLTFLLYRVAIKQIKSATATEIELDEKGKKKLIIKKEIIVEIKTISTVKSFIRKDLISATRDYQTFLFFLMPIIYPIILVLSMSSLISQEVASLQSIIVLWSIVFGVNLFIPFLLVAGFLNMEESGASILSSLPLLSREQAKAKIYLMLTIQALGLGLMGIILMIMTQSLLLLILFLLTIPIAWVLLLFTFETKIRFFGRMKYKYVVEEVNKVRKVLKWLVLIGSELLIYFTILIIIFTLLGIYGILGIIIGLIAISVIGLSSLLYIFTRMFPKEKEIATYYTGGLLRRNVIAGTIIIMMLYFIFQNVVGFIELPFLSFLQEIPLEFSALIEVILVFIVFTFLFFVIIPRGMKLPNGKDSLKNYSYSIGFSRTKPLAINIILGIFSFILFSLSSVLFAMLLSEYIFDPSVLFGYPNWRLLYYMLIPGIWEEVTFRGVILNLQLRKYSKLTSVILNGIAFGLMHLFNLLAGFDPFYVVNQVFFATCLGIALAYIYVKTNSLLPCIIIHYLIDSFGQLFLPDLGLFPNIASVIVYFIYGIGVVPMVLILGLVILVVRKRKE